MKAFNEEFEFQAVCSKTGAVLARGETDEQCVTNLERSVGKTLVWRRDSQVCEVGLESKQYDPTHFGYQIIHRFKGEAGNLRSRVTGGAA